MTTIDPEATPGTDQIVLARRDAFVAARDLYLTVALGAMPSGRIDASRFDRGRPVFVQYFNPEIFACYGLEINGSHSGAILRNALLATRLALLATDRHLIFPSSYIFEVKWFDHYLRLARPLVGAGHIRYTAPVAGLAEYREIKVLEYRKESANPYLAYDESRLSAHRQLIWAPRPGQSTATDIGAQWRIALAPGGDLHGLVRSVAIQRHRTYGRTENFLLKTPERLDGQAFIRRFVEQTLATTIPNEHSRSLAFFLSAAYLESYVADLDAVMLADFPIADLSCGFRRRFPNLADRLLSARQLDDCLRWLRVHAYIHNVATWDELIEIRSSAEFKVIASTFQGDYTLAFTLAVLASRRSGLFQSARTYPQAMANMALVADKISDQMAPYLTYS